MATELEYLEEALEEAEAAARWYAERSVSAALGFSEEINAAESAIVEFHDELTLDRSAIASIETGQMSGEMAELVRRKVIVDLPKRYY